MYAKCEAIQKFLQFGYARYQDNFTVIFNFRPKYQKKITLQTMGAKFAPNANWRKFNKFSSFHSLVQFCTERRTPYVSPPSSQEKEPLTSHINTLQKILIAASICNLFKYKICKYLVRTLLTAKYVYQEFFQINYLFLL